MGVDLISEPRLICEPEHGTASACWFWNSRRLSLLADRGWFKAITRSINGGYNGLADRRSYWERNRVILGLEYINLDEEAEAVRLFQRDHGLIADGAIGPRTFAALAL
jgi:hypothetical protein